jgi:hypothetical protein
MGCLLRRHPSLAKNLGSEAIIGFDRRRGLSIRCKPREFHALRSPLLFVPLLLADYEC